VVVSCVRLALTYNVWLQIKMYPQSPCKDNVEPTLMKAVSIRDLNRAWSLDLSYHISVFIHGKLCKSLAYNTCQ
jgi:hypothetical protein